MPTKYPTTELHFQLTAFLLPASAPQPESPWEALYLPPSIELGLMEAKGYGLVACPWVFLSYHSPRHTHGLCKLPLFHARHQESH